MIDGILIVLLVITALWTVMTARLLRSGIGLALVSALVAIILFRLNAPTAGVFELSVCAGLIPVIFITTISFTRRLKPEEVAKARIAGLRRYWFLPILMAFAIAPIFLFEPGFDYTPTVTLQGTDVRTMLWGVRHLDLMGQIAVLLAGAFGVAVFFKESRR